MNLIWFCDLVFKQAYALSGRFSHGQDPSIFRACLFVSAALFINVLTCLFLLEALLGIVVNLSKAAFVATNLLFLVGCSVFVVIRKDSILSDTASSPNAKSRGFAIYIAFSLILFCVSAAFLYHAG